MISTAMSMNGSNLEHESNNKSHHTVNENVREHFTQEVYIWVLNYPKV